VKTARLSSFRKTIDIATRNPPNYAARSTARERP
jgi:hypothetical protein